MSYYVDANYSNPNNFTSNLDLYNKELKLLNDNRYAIRINKKGKQPHDCTSNINFHFIDHMYYNEIHMKYKKEVESLKKKSSNSKHKKTRNPKVLDSQLASKNYNSVANNNNLNVVDFLLPNKLKNEKTFFPPIFNNFQPESTNIKFQNLRVTNKKKSSDTPSIKENIPQFGNLKEKSGTIVQDVKVADNSVYIGEEKKPAKAKFLKNLKFGKKNNRSTSFLGLIVNNEETIDQKNNKDVSSVKKPSYFAKLKNKKTKNDTIPKNLLNNTNKVQENEEIHEEVSNANGIKRYDSFLNEFEQLRVKKEKSKVGKKINCCGLSFGKK